MNSIERRICDLERDSGQDREPLRIVWARGDEAAAEQAGVSLAEYQAMRERGEIVTVRVLGGVDLDQV